jgi:hypothetical protein
MVMAVPIVAPGGGEDGAAPVLSAWHYPDGAWVEAGALVCRLEDRSGETVDVAAPAAGILQQHCPAGGIGHAGALVGLVLNDGEAPARVPSGRPGEPVVVPFRSRTGDGLVTPLAEAGAAIPGLRLWEPDPDPPYAEARPAPTTREERFASISQAAAADSRLLSMEVAVPVAEAHRAVRVLAREWNDRGAEPIIEDLVLRALARAMEERGRGSSPAGLTLVRTSSDESVALAEASGRDFREAVRARASGGDRAFDDCAWVLTSVRAIGIRAAQPVLTAGHVLAATLSSVDQAGTIGVTIAYESSRIGVGDAARFLARVRMLLEEPYGLLA